MEAVVVGMGRAEAVVVGAEAVVVGVGAVGAVVVGVGGVGAGGPAHPRLPQDTPLTFLAFLLVGLGCVDPTVITREAGVGTSGRVGFGLVKPFRFHTGAMWTNNSVKNQSELYMVLVAVPLGVAGVSATVCLP